MSGPAVAPAKGFINLQTEGLNAITISREGVEDRRVYGQDVEVVIGGRASGLRITMSYVLGAWNATVDRKAPWQVSIRPFGPNGLKVCLQAPTSAKLVVRQWRLPAPDSGTTYETREVLAGAYQGKGRSLRSLLKHTVQMVNGLEVAVLCNRVDLHSIADGNAGNDLAAPPTCPRCLSKDPRHQPLPEGTPA